MTQMGRSEGICLHFRYGEIAERLGQALAGNAKLRCIWFFKSPHKHKSPTFE